MRISRSHFLSRDEEHATVVVQNPVCYPKAPPYPQAGPTTCASSAAAPSTK